MDNLEIFIPILCLSINVLVQILVFRYVPKLGLLKSEYLGFAIGLVAFLLFKFYISSFYLKLDSDLIAFFFVDLVTYCALGYCYFHFVNLSETARRIRILRELYDAREGLSIDQILQHYNALEIVKKRIDRLINAGQVVIKNNKYYIGNPIMLFIAKSITAMKLILFGRKTTEFN